MISSLKAYTPALSRLVGTSPAALYERQRALVRAGLLGAQEGRGPGSGVHVGPYSVALLLIAILATDSLSDTAARVGEIAKAMPSGRSKACPLTGRSSFVDAMAHTLVSKSASRKVEAVTVDRETGIAAIKYREGGRSIRSEFTPSASSATSSSSLKIEATLERATIVAIADDLHAILQEVEIKDQDS